MGHENLIITGKPRKRGISQQSLDLLASLEKGITSPDVLAKETGLPESLVSRRINNLIHHGHLKVQRE